MKPLLIILTLLLCLGYLAVIFISSATFSDVALTIIAISVAYIAVKEKKG